MFTPHTTLPGISAHQKLDLLSHLVELLGYEGISVFGDCFDEVTLLDPVRFPGQYSNYYHPIVELEVFSTFLNRYMPERMLNVSDTCLF